MTSKTKLVGNIAKINLILCEPPSIISTVNTAHFPLETFDEPLHLPAPNLHFKERKSKLGHSGVPMYLIASCTNARFQPMRETQLSVIIKLGTRIIYPTAKDQEIKRPTSTVDPQKWITFPLNITCPVDGILKATTRATFKFENTNQDLIQTTDLTIAPSVSMIRSKTSNVIQVQVENKMRQLLLDVKARTPDKQSSALARYMKFEETASTFFRFEKPVDKIEISWSLPTAPKCWQIIGLERPPDKKVHSVEINFTNVPQEIPALKPFVVTMVLKNTTATPLGGEIQFQKGDRVLHLVGKNRTVFESIPENSEIQMPFNFIALSQGSYSFPNVEVRLEGNKQVYGIESGVGILVVGHDDE